MRKDRYVKHENLTFYIYWEKEIGKAGICYDYNYYIIYDSEIGSLESTLNDFVRGYITSEQLIEKLEKCQKFDSVFSEAGRREKYLEFLNIAAVVHSRLFADEKTVAIPLRSFEDAKAWYYNQLEKEVEDFNKKTIEPNSILSQEVELSLIKRLDNWIRERFFNEGKVKHPEWFAKRIGPDSSREKEYRVFLHFLELRKEQVITLIKKGVEISSEAEIKVDLPKFAYRLDLKPTAASSLIKLLNTEILSKKTPKDLAMVLYLLYDLSFLKAHPYQLGSQKELLSELKECFGGTGGKSAFSDNISELNSQDSEGRMLDPMYKALYKRIEQKFK